MKKLRFFGLLVTIALLAFGLTIGCSNGSTDEEVETQSSVFTGKTAAGQDVEITFSNVAIAKARAAGPYQNGFYLLKIDGVEKSRGRTRLDSNKDITFIPDGGGTEFHGELLNGVLEVSGTVDGVALNVRTTTEDSGTTPGGVGGGGGSGTGGGTREVAETPVIGGLSNAYEQEIGVALTLTATVDPVSDGGTVTTAWYKTESNHSISGLPTAGTALSLPIPEPDNVAPNVKVYYVFVATNAVEGKTSKSARVEITITYKEAEVVVHVPVTGITITDGQYVNVAAASEENESQLVWTVEPENATYDDIEWTIPTTTGVEITNAGKITVTDQAVKGTITASAIAVGGGATAGTDSTAFTGTIHILALGELVPPEITLTDNPTGVTGNKYVGGVTKIELGPAVENMTIYYKISGTETGTIDNTATAYTVPTAILVSVEGNQVIEAAYSSDDGTTLTSEVRPLAITQAAVPDPVITLAGTVTDGEAGVEEYLVGAATPSTYTVAADADSPAGTTVTSGTTSAAAVITESYPVTISTPTTVTIYAKASATGWADAEIEKELDQAQVPAPVIALTGEADDAVDGGYIAKTTTGASKFTVTTGTFTPDAIRYAAGNTAPAADNTGTGYTAGGVEFDGTTLGAGDTQEISVAVFKTGYISNDATEEFDKAQVKKPTITPDGEDPIVWATLNSIVLACDTPGATIYYELDGASDPDDNNTEYTGSDAPIDVTSVTTGTKTVKAIAYKDGYKASAVASATFAE